MRLGRVLAAVMGATVIATMLAPVAHAEPQDPAGSGSTESITVSLTPSDRQLLSQLSSTHGITIRNRHSLLSQAIASQSRQTSVTDFLTSNGLAVTSSTPFAITAQGPSQTIDALFPRGATAQATRSIPAALAGVAQYAISSSFTGIRFHPLAGSPAAACSSCIEGPGYPAVYDIPASATTTDGAGITIATLQFSGWDAASLSTYAAQYGLKPDPVVSGQYRAISVDGANPTTPDGTGGDGEVALDQETILGAAPKANQAAYFAPNTAQGEIDALNQIATDALAHRNGWNYTALSISWGLCERDAGPSGMVAVSSALANVVAAGVTVFASSGDSGAYDCSTKTTPDNTLAVDFPASDPHVIGVGGLSTTVGTSVVETGWWDTSTSSAGFLGNGSGGGISTHWTQPAWQNGRNSDTAHRLVPDIALNGDPGTGIPVYVGGTWTQYGGTSLASPLAAATLTDLQISRGPATAYGLGSISAALYGASAAGFRDTTVGTNGGYSTAVGYDLVTGLGAPKWSHLATALYPPPTVQTPAVTDNRTVPLTLTIPTGASYSAYLVGTGTPPGDCTVPAGVTSAAPTQVTVPADGSYVFWVVAYTARGACFTTQSLTLVDTTAPASGLTAMPVFTTGTTMPVAWTATDGAGSGVASTDVRLARIPSASAASLNWTVWKSASTSHSATLSGPSLGTTYCFSSRARDLAGNVGAWSPAVCSTTPRDDRSLALRTPGWSRVNAPGYLASTYTAATRFGATIATPSSVSARRIGLVAMRCPTCGSVAVYVGSSRVGTISLASRTTVARSQIALPAFTSVKSGVVRFVVTTRGRTVRIDSALFA